MGFRLARLLAPLVAGALILVSVSGHAAGFDCSKAISAAEKAVCADSRLSELDGQLMTTWKKVSRTGTSSTVRLDQLQWLKLRDACGADISCLTARYGERLEALNTIQTALADDTSSDTPKHPRVIPHSGNVGDVVYLSTLVRYKPCLSGQALKDTGFQPEDLKDVIAARNALPPGTCDDPARVEKLFAARFLQDASIAMVKDPWRFNATLLVENKRISECRDVSCLDHELDAIIKDLSPIYLQGHFPWPRGRGLCAQDPVDTPAGQTMALLNSQARKTIRSECGEEAVTTQTCSGPHGEALFVSCEMEGNQVNAPQWLYRANETAEPLLATEDGPIGVMDSTCNGMQDLLTVSRGNAGEHSWTFYRYDGRRYQSAYSYTEFGIGSDDNGNDLTVASDGGVDTKVVCH